MNKIIVTFENGNKATYKSKFSIVNDTINMLAPNILKGNRDKEIDTLGKEYLCTSYYNCNITIEKLDGRTKEAKGLNYFNWGLCFDNMIVKHINLWSK